MELLILQTLCYIYLEAVLIIPTISPLTLKKVKYDHVSVEFIFYIKYF